MSVKTLLKDLENETGAKEQEILEKARKEADQIISKLEPVEKKFEEKLEKEVRKEKERMERRELSSVELEIKALKLKKAKEEFSIVKKQALERLRELPKEQRQNILLTLIRKARKEFDCCSTPILSDPDVKFAFKSDPNDKSFIENNSDFTYAGPLENEGGLYIFTVDGSLSYDLTFSKLLDQYWEKAMKSVSSILEW